MDRDSGPDGARALPANRTGKAEQGGDDQKPWIEEHRLRHRQANPDLNRMPEHEQGDGGQGEEPTGFPVSLRVIVRLDRTISRYSGQARG